LGKSRRSS